MFDYKETVFDTSTEISIPKIEDILRPIPSGIGLDIAKRHSGLALWNGQEVKQYGFELQELDKSDPHALYRMRVDLKDHLKDILGGQSFSCCIIEDVYGGENFDTVQKLVTLNTVIDELIFEGSVQVDKFYRWKESTWLKQFRSIFKANNHLRAKVETQQILEYLQEPFYVAHKDASQAEKQRLFFEDICDATAMLCSVALYEQAQQNPKKPHITIGKVAMRYINHKEDFDKLKVPKLKGMPREECTLKERESIERQMVRLCEQNPTTVKIASLPVDRLGAFGIKRKFTYYEDGKGYLVFWNK